MGGKFTKPVQKKPKHFKEDLPIFKEAKGKVIIITGCTAGMGRLVADQMGKNGAQAVVLLNRPSDRAATALKELKETVPTGNFIHIDCDLLSFESVKAAAVEVKKQFGDHGVDVLFNNAAIMAFKDQPKQDGLEQQMLTNHLSHFLLTHELMPLLEKAANDRGEARIVNHASLARKMGSGNKELQEQYFKPQEIKQEKSFTGQLRRQSSHGGDGGDATWRRYQQTKLANVCFTYGLADRLKANNSKVKALVCAPGIANTNLQVSSTKGNNDGANGSPTMMWFFQKVTGQSVEDGALPALHCMLDPAANSRDFFIPDGMGELGGKAKLLPQPEPLANEEALQNLWKWSCETCKIENENWPLPGGQC